MVGVGVESIHGGFGSLFGPDQCSLGGVGHGGFDDGLFIGGEPREHEVGGFEAGRRLSDPDSQPSHLGGLESPEDIGESLLASGGTLLAESQASQREIEVIADDEDLFGLELVEVQEWTDGLAAVVHEGLGCDQQQPGLPERHFADLGIEAIA